MVYDTLARTLILDGESAKMQALCDTLLGHGYCHGYCHGYSKSRNHERRCGS
jgi:hypothetical protein